LFVLAELAKDFCLRAYEMHRSDKHLYLVWPRVMAALKECDKARVRAKAVSRNVLACCSYPGQVYTVPK
jgi:hypothetical protein